MIMCSMEKMAKRRKKSTSEGIKFFYPETEFVGIMEDPDVEDDTFETIGYDRTVRPRKAVL